MKLGFDRQLWLCGLLTLCVVLPRSLLIARAHSPILDADEHLDQGLSYLKREAHPQAYYDPPLGKMILALPLWLAGSHVEMTTYRAPDGYVRHRRTVQYNQPVATSTLEYIQAAWKSTLFVPCVMVVFVWCRRIYGIRSAWLAVGLFLVEPTIAAHIPVAALDVLAMEAGIISSFLAWRFVESPTIGRTVGAGVATAGAVLIKHTLLLLPLAFIALTALQWFVMSRSRLQRRARLNALMSVTLVAVISFWAFTLFDFSAPAQNRDISGICYDDGFDLRRDIIAPAMEIRWPAGVYIGSIIGGFEHTGEGHSAYLWGEFREHGWSYYFLAVALYKVPLGIWFIAALAVVSLFAIRPRWEEIGILIPMLACAALLVSTGYNVGFRHALPMYGLLLMLMSRCSVPTNLVWSALAWLGVAAAAADTLRMHPDYITYTSGISRRPYLAISDSNVDWGQSIKQIRAWLEDHPQRDRKVWIDLFNDIADPAIDLYLEGRAQRLPAIGPLPDSGILIASPLRLIGLYGVPQRYDHLRDVEPIDVIGHCLLVYDLDVLSTDVTNGTKRNTHP